MAKNFEDLGGIGVRIVADASKIKADFDRELGTLSAQPVKIPITIDDRGKIAALRKQLQGLDVPISVKVNRETARSLKRSIQQHLENEPVQIPIKAKGPSSDELASIRGDITSAFENITATVIVNWDWGPSGAPPSGTTMGGGPTGGAPSGGYWRPRAGGPTGQAQAQQIDMGPVVGGINPLANPNTSRLLADIEAAAAGGAVAGGAAPASGRGSGRRRSTLRRGEAESGEEHAQRLTQLYAEAEQKFQAAVVGSREATLAYNRMIDIRKKPEFTGPREGPTERLPVPRKGEESRHPLRQDPFGNVVRGPERVGAQLSDVRQREFRERRQQELVARQGGEGPERVSDAELTAAIRERYGIEFDESGALVAVGQNAPRARDIERYAGQREFAAVRQGMGFRGQRASRAPFGTGTGISEEETERRRLQRVAETEAAGAAPTEDWRKFVAGLQRGEGGRFISKEARGEKYREVLGPHFAAGEEALGRGELGEALQIIGARRGELLGGAFAKTGTSGSIPGVGPATAKRFLDKKRGSPEKETPEQTAWWEEMGGLEAIRNEISNRIEALRKQGRQEEGNAARKMTLAGETFGRTPTMLEKGAGNVGAGGTPVMGGGLYERPMTPREQRSHARAQRGPEGPQDPIAQISDEIAQLGSQLESAQMPEMRARVPGTAETKELTAELKTLTSEIEPLREAQSALAQRREAETPGERAKRASEAGVTPQTIQRRESREAGRLEEEIGTRTARTGEIQRRLSLRDTEEVLQSKLADAQERLQQEIAQRRAATEEQPEPLEVELPRAAEQAVPPSVPPGVMHPEMEWVPGAGGEGPPGPPTQTAFLGGAGGPIPVNVMNWPGWMESQEGMAGGMVGGTRVLTDEEIKAVADRVKLPDQIAAEKKAEEREKRAEEKKAKAQAVREEKEAIPKYQRATQQPGAIAGRLGRAGLLTEEEQAEILFPPRQRAGEEPGGPVGRFENLLQAQMQIQEQLAASRQGLPIRGAGVTVAQLVAGPSRGGITERLALGGRKMGEAIDIEREQQELTKTYALQEKALTRVTDMQDKGVKLTKQQREEYQQIPGELEEIAAKTTDNMIAQEGLVKEADELTKLTAGEKMANLGKSFAGNIAGIMTFSAALGGATAAVGLAGIALGDYLERSTGYLLATQQITNALSDQSRAAGGAVQQTVAQTAATANMTNLQYENVAANLEGRAEIEAGNKAYDEQLKLQAAAKNVEAGQRTIGGTTFDQGLFQTTGGWLGTPFLGTPSTGELVSRDIEAASRGVERVAGGPNAVSQEPVNPETGLRPLTDEMAAAVAEYTTDLGILNEDFKDTGIQFVAATDKNAVAIDESAKAFEDAGFGDIGQRIRDRDVAIAAGEAEALRGEGGEFDLEKIAAAMQVGAERNARPDPEVLIAQLRERIVPALREGIEMQLKNQQEIFLPAQRAVQFAAQPIPAFGRGLVPLGEAPAGTRGQQGARPDLGGVSGLTTQAAPMIGGTAPPETTRFGGVRQSAIDSFRQYEAEASKVIKNINALATEGDRVLAEKLGVPESVITELKGYGERIDALRQEQADIRLDVEMTQYNRQLELARRTLGDLAGLTGREGGTFIGQLQRQDMLLSRRSQWLSIQSAELSLQTTQLGLQSAEIGQQQNLMQLERAQRQVNFQRAIAGFTAPGTTPEERAARIEEAKVEADYAQREIDFQRQQLTIQQKTLVINREQFALQQASVGLSVQQYGVQVALQDAINNRGYQDQLDTIQEMVDAAEAQDQINVRQNMIDLIATERDLFTESLNKQIEAEQTFIDEMTKFTTDIMEKTGVFTTEVVNQVTELFEEIRSQPSPFPSWMTGGSGERGCEPDQRAPAVPSDRAKETAASQVSRRIRVIFLPRVTAVESARRHR